MSWVPAGFPACFRGAVWVCRLAVDNTMTFMRWLRRQLRHPISILACVPLSVTAWLLVKLCAPRRAYRHAVRLVLALYPLLAPAYARLHPQKLARDRRGIILQWMFGVMSRHGFIDLEIRVNNLTALRHRRAEGRGVILCTAHTGLTMAMFAVIEREGWANVLISGGSGHGWNWGCHHPIRLIRPSGDCLLRLRARLREGAVAIVYPDTQPSYDGPQTVAISPNLFRFARMTATPLLYYDACLAEDGMIEIAILEPGTGDPEEFAALLAERHGWKTAIVNAPNKKR